MGRLIKSKTLRGGYIVVGCGRRLLVPSKKAGMEMIKAYEFREKNRKEMRKRR